MAVKKSTWLPALLFAYLCVMAYIGRGELLAGHYVYYFTIIFLTVAAIVALRIFLKKRGR